MATTLLLEATPEEHRSAIITALTHRDVQTVPTDTWYNLITVARAPELTWDTKLPYITGVLDRTLDVLQDNPLLAEERATHARELTVKTVGVTTVESKAIKCPYCQQQRVRIEFEQIKAADEAQTVKYSCTTCGRGWIGRN